MRDVTIDVSPRFSYDRRIDDDPLSVAWPRIPPGYRLMFQERVSIPWGYSRNVNVRVRVSTDADIVLRTHSGDWMRPHARENSERGVGEWATWFLDNPQSHVDVAMKSGSVTGELGPHFHIGYHPA